jgi:ribosomal protein L23
MKKIEDNNTLVFIVDVRSNKRQISMVSAAKFPCILANKQREGEGEEKGEEEREEEEEREGIAAVEGEEITAREH